MNISGRGDGDPARRARRDKEKSLTKEYMDQFLDEGCSVTEAKSKAKFQAKEDMKELAALHGPDMCAGGFNDIKGFGNTGINSSLGRQWNVAPSSSKITHVQVIDEYVKTIPQ